MIHLLYVLFKINEERVCHNKNIYNFDECETKHVLTKNTFHIISLSSLFFYIITHKYTYNSITLPNQMLLICVKVSGYNRQSEHS